MNRVKLPLKMPNQSRPIAMRPMSPEDQTRILESILGSVEMGVMLTDLEHTTLAVNERFGELFGIPHDAAVQGDVESLRNAVRARIVDHAGWAKNLDTVYADPRLVQDDQLTLVLPHLVLERHTSPVLDADGQPFARLWTFRDFTREHHQAQVQQLLQELSLHFDPRPNVVYEKIVRSLSEFYNSTSVLSILDGDMMRFQAIASPIPEVQAMTQNELENTYCQFCLEVDRPIIIQNALDNPRMATIFPARVGVTRYIGVPLRKPSGEIIGTLCILDHYSDVEVTEDDLRLLSLMGMRVSNELERETRMKALESELEISEARMIQNEKLAITGTLAASVAHDIRNIVSAVTLDLGASHESAEDRLQRAESHMDRFNVLAARLLSYVKPKKVARQSVSIEESVQRVAELLGRHIEVTKTFVNLNLPANLPPVRADSGRLEHLFVNLFLNAIQVMKAGGMLTISAAAKPGQVLVQITDSGPGMSDEQVSKAFEPFQSSRHDGFGLGLYSCHQIMKEIDGHISCSSELGVGTTFTLEFVTE